MALGNTNHPDFVSGMSNSSGWINQILNFICYRIFSPPPIRITTQPGTIVPGQVYLIGSGSTFGVPGDAVIFLTVAPTSIIPATPLIGTVMGSWTKVAGDWARTDFTPGSVVIYTAAATVTLPVDFDGIATLVVDTVAGVVVNGAAGRTNKGLAGTSLPVGIYTVFQNSTTCVVG